MLDKIIKFLNQYCYTREGYKDKKKMTVTAKRSKPIMKGIER